MTIDYENSTDTVFDFDENELSGKLVEAAMNYLECPYEVCVNISVVSETKIRELNKEFRSIDAETDVLSFPMCEYESGGRFDGDIFLSSMETDPDTGELLLGDVILSAGRILSQAAEYGHGIKREFSFLVVHSLLHLCGYDHIEDEQRKQMESIQGEILNGLGIVR